MDIERIITINNHLTVYANPINQMLLDISKIFRIRKWERKGHKAGVGNGFATEGANVEIFHEKILPTNEPFIPRILCECCNPLKMIKLVYTFNVTYPSLREQPWFK